jgi:ABC-2 type transport system ATP-binding protein
MSDGNLIELKQVRKVFGRRVAVDALDLRVPAGEIFGLLGHNGAGKSTAIGMMLGQVWPDAGEIKLFGLDVTRHRQQALQRVGAIFEAPCFYDFLSGWRNLEILSGFSGPTPKQRIAEVIEWVGLTGREKAKVKTYSHGMRARLALAQALLPKPELLILDEPSDGLDPEGIHEMRQTILRLRRELGLTLLLSSHLLNEVEQLCTRIAVLQQGQKIFEGALIDAKKQGNWFRLKTGDFAIAKRELESARMIKDATDGLISLADGVGSEQVVKMLVERGLPVYEMAREEDTLENFYLTLMRERPAGGGN